MLGRVTLDVTMGTPCSFLQVWGGTWGGQFGAVGTPGWSQFGAVGTPHSFLKVWDGEGRQFGTLGTLGMVAVRGYGDALLPTGMGGHFEGGGHFGVWGPLFHPEDTGEVGGVGW